MASIWQQTAEMVRRYKSVGRSLLFVAIVCSFPISAKAGRPTSFEESATNNWAEKSGKATSVATIESASNWFTVDWQEVNEGFCYGKGWTATNAPNYDDISFSYYYGPTGAGCAGIYGWLESPQDGYVEYYICENVGNIEGPHNNDNDGDMPIYMGNYSTSDGESFSFYTHKRKNKPSPKGDTNFTQWIAINRRVDAAHWNGQYFRSSGTIHVKDHFNLWQTNYSKTYSSRYWQVWTVESWVTPAQNTPDPKNPGVLMNPDGKGSYDPSWGYAWFALN